MNKNIVSVREMQRNYRKLIDQVKETGRPMYLATHSQTEAVLLDINSYEKLQEQASRREDWSSVKKTLDRISKGGKGKNVNLGNFIHTDRETRKY
jgi:prevent-host-death family protein